MAYGLSTRMPREDGAIVEVVKAARSWRLLSDKSRLEAIEQALLAANDRIDGYPLAL